MGFKGPITVVSAAMELQLRQIYFVRCQPPVFPRPHIFPLQKPAWRQRRRQGWWRQRSRRGGDGRGRDGGVNSDGAATDGELREYSCHTTVVGVLEDVVVGEKRCFFLFDIDTTGFKVPYFVLTAEIQRSGIRHKKKGSDGSSSSSESDLELDEVKEENDNSIFYALSQKIIELEDELHEVSDVETSSLQKDLDEVKSEKEALEAVFLVNKDEIDRLKESMVSAAKQFEVELAHRDTEIDKCKQELEVLSEKYLHDISALEAEIGKLQ
ncbi:hypothetical protein E2562_018694 [Oryza meyeriana var. granulata]|uniref:Uncharacterized protein n=1 Tax=Oryza meyeriana var. granulata TaxID=110450 RepID=A0A6G1EMM9_9ORYZ|nr:hypothetical protein E2562_018694 [Oryza meyeriana var. granulata]